MKTKSTVLGAALLALVSAPGFAADHIGRVTLPNGRVVSGGTPGDGGPQDTGATKPGS